MDIHQHYEITLQYFFAEHQNLKDQERASTYTLSEAYAHLEAQPIISMEVMDRKGRALYNIFIEQFF